MTSLQGYATTVAPVTEIVCAYASAPYQPTAIAANAPWVVFGSFTVPIAVAARLCVAGLNTGPAVLTVAIYNPAQMSDSVLAVTSGVESECLSAPISLLPGVVYQIAAQYSGTTGLAVIRTASLRSA